MTRSDVPLDELGKWEAMPGDVGEAWRGEVGLGLPLPTPVTGSSPSSSFPPVSRPSPQGVGGGPTHLSPLLSVQLPTVTWQEARRRGWQAGRQGGALFKLGKVGPQPPILPGEE